MANNPTLLEIVEHIQTNQEIRELYTQTLRAYITGKYPDITVKESPIAPGHEVELLEFTMLAFATVIRYMEDQHTTAEQGEQEPTATSQQGS